LEIGAIFSVRQPLDLLHPRAIGAINVTSANLSGGHRQRPVLGVVVGHLFQVQTGGHVAVRIIDKRHPTNAAWRVPHPAVAIAVDVRVRNAAGGGVEIGVIVRRRRFRAVGAHIARAVIGEFLRPRLILRR